MIKEMVDYSQLMKSSGNPLIVRGGYNCRHQWSFVNPDWYDTDGKLKI